MNSKSVHLIATDPPFNKGRDFHATPDSVAKGAAFPDRWSWQKDVHEAWLDQISDDFPEVMNVIQASRQSYGDDMGAFLCFMAVRLLEMHRILRADGSMYLHCDPTASHYLKQVMDAIFGKRNFRNEIVWCYTGPNNARKQFQRKHDIILFYGMQDWQFYGEQIRVPYKAENPLHLSRGFGDRGEEEVADIQLQLSKGKIPTDWWAEGFLSNVSAWRKELVGFPTQKPLRLYERIIEASSKKGDVVLDPFCGCATTLIAAEKQKRQWVGIDIWKEAHEVVLKRLQGEGLSINGDKGGRLITAGDVAYLTTPPDRTDDSAIAAPVMRVKPKRMEAPDGLTNKQRKAQLVNDYGLVCQGCDREFDFADYLHLDHNIPRSEGGSNNIGNRLLLCPPCNLRKSNTLTLTGLRAENKKNGFMAGQKSQATKPAKQK